VIGVFAWFGAESYWRKKNLTRVQMLEAKLRFVEGRAVHLRDYSEKLQKELKQSRESLDRERETKAASAMQFHQSFKKGVLVSGTACLVFGFVFGGVISGLWATIATETKSRQEIMNLKVMARVAERNAEFFKNQWHKLQLDFDALRNMLDEEQIAKTIALTKLELILDNLIEDKWGRGYSLDPKNLKKKWDQSEKVKELASSARFIAPRAPAF